MDLDKAIAIAVKAHAGQKDLVGLPFILHPLRVMLAMDSLHDKIVAVLHDVLEDSSVTAADLLEAGFSTEAVLAVSVLTRSKDMTYKAYIELVKTNPQARRVKIADLRDNINRSWALPNDKARSLGRRYGDALATLERL